MGYGPTWPTDRAVVWTRDLERCVLCGQRVQDGHHREVQGMGGRRWDTSSLVARLEKAS